MESASVAAVLGEAASRAVHSATPSVLTVATTTTGTAAGASASDVVVVQGSSSWLGLFGRLVLWILHSLSTTLWFTGKLATIDLPTFIFTLFSTTSRLTVTMSATTL